jgi:hypothetical protein
MVRETFHNPLFQKTKRPTFFCAAIPAAVIPLEVDVDIIPRCVNTPAPVLRCSPRYQSPVSALPHNTGGTKQRHAARCEMPRKKGSDSSAASPKKIRKKEWWQHSSRSRHGTWQHRQEIRAVSVGVTQSHPDWRRKTTQLRAH